jgi:PKD repeat protein
MSKIFTPFEGKVREAMEHYEAPYDPKSWTQLEKQLTPPGAGGANHAWWVALAAATLFTGVVSYGIYDFGFRQTKARLSYQAGRFEVKPASVAGSSDSGSMENQILLADTQLSSEETGTNVWNNGSASEASVQNPSYRIITSDSSTDRGVINGNSQDSPEFNSFVPPVAEPKAASSGDRSLRFTADVSTACVGYEVNFNLANSPDDGKYLWNFGDGTFSNKPNTNHRYSKPGVYDVSLSITSDDGVIRSNVQKDMIVVNPSPNADFEWEFINDPTDAPTVKLVNVSDNASEFEWNFGDGRESSEISPVRSYVDKGKHMVALTVSNEFGCTDSKVKYVPVNTEYNLEAQKSIHLGEDIFMPKALKSGKIKFKLTVYKGSTPIFESAHKSKGWDGEMPDGSMAPAGEYPWIVIMYNERTNEEKYFSGLVTVIP